MFRIRTTLLAGSVVIAGCRSTTLPSSVLQPVATTANNETSLKPIGPWVLTPSSQPHTYRSISLTTVHELSNSSIRQNTIELGTTFTISIDQSHTPSIISGHIDTVNFRSQNKPPSENKAFR